MGIVPPLPGSTPPDQTEVPPPDELPTPQPGGPPEPPPVPEPDPEPKPVHMSGRACMLGA